MKKLISIIAPMYNESTLVNEYCKETLDVISQLSNDYSFEIVMVNDGSKDDTYSLMLAQQKAHPNIISTISLTRNFGLEGAVKAGLQKAKGDAVVVMDADLQDPPSLVKEMIIKWENGADVVICSRIKRSNDSFLKKFTANCYYKILNSLSGKLKLERSAANFRLLSREALNKLLDLREVNSVFRVVVPYIGMNTDIVEYDRDKRFSGKTKYSLKTMIPYALDSITGISVVPLRKLSYVLLVISLLFAISLIACFFVKDNWFIASFSISVFLFVSCLLMGAICVLAEYIAQIMIEVKGRPISLIHKYIPSETSKNKENQ